ncbi:hypothetical protein ABZT26_03170 [Streptomyces sp. NPDC005395]|uniref:hypothetical protein n=1 Tax=Streptomyces sp. NPDC005395 TaxID=3157042 RepID=UPI00339DE109
MIDAVLAGVLGAAILAIVLLYRGFQRNRELINQLRAEVAAAKIAAMAARPPVPTAVAVGEQPAPPGPEDPPPPVRKRRHLSLYKGGGIAALFISLLGCARAIYNKHQTSSALIAAASVAAVSSTAVMSVTPYAETPRPEPTPPAISAPERPDIAASDAQQPATSPSRLRVAEPTTPTPAPTPSPSASVEPLETPPSSPPADDEPPPQATPPTGSKEAPQDDETTTPPDDPPDDSPPTGPLDPELAETPTADDETDGNDRHHHGGRKHRHSPDRCPAYDDRQAHTM